MFDNPDGERVTNPRVDVVLTCGKGKICMTVDEAIEAQNMIQDVIGEAMRVRSTLRSEYQENQLKSNV